MSIRVIGFDADDTLWINENYFREGERKFCALMLPWHSEEKTMTILYNNEMDTLDIYGFGIKGFMLSMIETASQIAKEELTTDIVNEIISIGKSMLRKPVELFKNVASTLEVLKQKYRLVLVTKGDLLDQERKLKKSGLENYFHHIEVMSDKQESDYQQLIQHLDINAEEFLMIGNSVKSDVLPVLNLGGSAVHIPFHTTWLHEKADPIKHEKLRSLQSITDLPDLLK